MLAEGAKTETDASQNIKEINSLDGLDRPNKPREKPWGDTHGVESLRLRSVFANGWEWVREICEIFVVWRYIC